MGDVLPVSRTLYKPGGALPGVIVTALSPQYLYPIGHGAVAPWTGNVYDLDDTQPIANHDSDTTYMEVVNPGVPTGVIRTYHLFTHTPMIAMPTGQAITSVTLRAAARRVSGSSGEVRGAAFRISGVVYTQNTQLIVMLQPGVAYATGSVTIAVSPATGVAWTRAEIQEMQFGVGVGADGVGTYRVSALFMEVTYA